jgi:hypothetical protein
MLYSSFFSTVPSSTSIFRGVMVHFAGFLLISLTVSLDATVVRREVDRHMEGTDTRKGPHEEFFSHWLEHHEYINSHALSTLPSQIDFLSEYIALKDKAKHTTALSARPHSEGKGTLVMFLSGLLKRVIIHSKLTNVVEAAVQDGYNVDVHVSLVNVDGTDWKGEASTIGHRASSPYMNMPDSFMDLFRQAVEAAGGRVVSSEILAKDMDVRDMAGKSAKYEIMTQYPPSSNENGVNVLRRFKSLESFANSTFKDGLLDGHAGSSRDFVLVTREDDQWLGPLRLDEFTSQSNTVFTRNCAEFYGVNDKTLLFGREAARKVLKAVYSNFTSVTSSFNAEQHLKRFIEGQSAVSATVPWGKLPTVEVVYQSDNDSAEKDLCVSGSYMPNEPRQIYGEWYPGCDTKGFTLPAKCM